MIIEFLHRPKGDEHASHGSALREALDGSADNWEHTSQMLHAVFGTHPWLNWAVLMEDRSHRVRAVFYYDQDPRNMYLVAKDSTYTGGNSLPRRHSSTRLAWCVLGEHFRTVASGEAWAAKQFRGGAVVAVVLSRDGQILRAWEQGQRNKPQLVAENSP